jgi:hypothetical protein
MDVANPGLEGVAPRETALSIPSTLRSVRVIDYKLAKSASTNANVETLHPVFELRPDAMRDVDGMPR